MSRVEQFEDLIAWQKARALAKRLRDNWMVPPMSGDFDMVSQLRRCSRSTMANIAEGFGRAGGREFHRFLSNASGSNTETQSHLYSAFDCQYINEQQLQSLLADAQEVGRIIAALQSAIRRRLDEDDRRS
jgi:four helix bundle protein